MALVFHNNTKDSQEHFNKLTQLQKEILVQELSIELSRAGIAYTNLTTSFDNVILIRRIPIFGLTESTFMEQFDQMQRGQTLAGQFVIFRAEQMARGNRAK
jgi:serine kinase of HPr protein (carbohydrate metabolism regulator)